MAEGPGEIELYNQWFKVADQDGDGVLGGGEAVQFFQRSGLPRSPTLFKIWQIVAGDRSSLTRQEFYTAMKLVSVAQRSQGQLDEGVASRIVNGLAGAVPPPSMAGMEISGMGMARMEGSGMSVSSASAGQFQAMAGGISLQGSGEAVSKAYPPLSREKAFTYQTAFEQLDNDNDGLVKGVDCFGAFMKSGLSKPSLKKIWDVVAGNEGSLNRHQFIQCLYLIDCAKLHHDIPESLPSGQFPPIEGGAYGIQEMMSTKGDIYTTLKVGELPPKVEYQGNVPSSFTHASMLPPRPAQQTLAGLTTLEVSQLESERNNAEKKEEEYRRLEEEKAAAIAKREFFTSALAELRMSESRISRALVEAEQRAEMEKQECIQIESHYDQAYAEYSSQHARIGPLLQTLEKVEAEKSSLLSKKSALETAIAQLQEYDPDWEDKEKGECESLKKEISQLMAQHDSIRKNTEDMYSRRNSLISTIEELKASIFASESAVEGLEKELQAQKDEELKDGDKIVTLLKNVAPIYNRLYQAAKDAMVPLPEEALASILKPGKVDYLYDPSRFGAYTGQWEIFDSEDYVISSALPLDDRLQSFVSKSIRNIEENEEDEEKENSRQEGSENDVKEETSITTVQVVDEVQEATSEHMEAEACRQESEASAKEDHPMTEETIPEENTVEES